MAITKSGRIRLTLSNSSLTGYKVKKARARIRQAIATGAEIQAEARRYAVDALKALQEIVRSPISADVARISAAQTLLDRGYGRPTQTNVNATVNTDGKPQEITDQELNRRIEESLRAVEDITRAAGTPKRKREKIQSEDRPADIRKLH